MRGAYARHGTKGTAGLTTAKSTAAIPDGTTPVPRPPWWATAATLLGIAVCVVLLATVAIKNTGAWTDAPAPIVVSGPDWIPVQGSGHRDGEEFVLEAAGTGGVTVLSAKLAPFQAKDFPRVEWMLASADPPSEAFFVWRTREHPRRNYSKRLEWLVDGIAPLELRADDGWSGTVTGVALVIRSGLTAPLLVKPLRIVALSAVGVANDIFRQWSKRVILRGYSVTFPFDIERAHYVPLLAAVAIAEGIAMAAYLLLARRRGWPRDRRVLWAIFVGGWALLDLRWQIDLWSEVADRGQRFAGKTTEEKHLAEGDAALYVLMAKMQSALPSGPSRVVLYCDNVAICSRAAFYLYPHNVLRAVDSRVKPPDPGLLRAGDYLLLAFSRTLGYDPSRAVVVWPDGRTRPADLVLLQPEALLLRIR